MHIDAFEARLVERSGHFHLPVHALLTQDRHPRVTRFGERRSDVVVVIETQADRQTGVGFNDARELLGGALRIVTQRLHLHRRLRPCLLQHGAPLGIDRPFTVPDADVRAVVHRADELTAGAQSGTLEQIQHIVAIAVTHLQHGTEFLIEQHGQVVLGQAGQVDIQATATGKRHFAQGREQAAIGPVVIREDQSVAIEVLQHGEQGLEQCGIIHIGRYVTDLSIDLRQC